MKTSKRKPLSKKVRFEVFKRDSFACQYCGLASPDVVLHVDHIKPVSQGGTNRLTNLITSCQPCNSGKGARELSDKTVVSKQKAQLDALQERREQIEMMMAWHDGLREEKSIQLAKVKEYAENLFGFSIYPDDDKVIKASINKFGLKIVLEALDKGAETYFQKQSGGLDDTLRKLSGICACIKDPAVAEVSHIKNILNQKCCIPYSASKTIMGYRNSGATYDQLKAVAYESDDWSDFVEAMET